MVLEAGSHSLTRKSKLNHMAAKHRLLITKATQEKITEQKINFSLSVDKLTLVFDPIPQCGGEQPTRDEVIKFFIGMILDTSLQSSLGIFRPNTRARGGYEVVIAGKVPISENPLIWSQNTGYLLQIGCKRPGASFYRLDINPVALNARGLAHIQELFDHHFHIGWDALRTGTVTRVDAALDIDGVSIDDFIWDMKQRKKRQTYASSGKYETIYLGAKNGSPLVIYNKAKQLGLQASQKRTRLEFRHCKSQSLQALRTLPCPFEKLKVIDPMELASTPMVLRRAILAAGNALGTLGILRLYPSAAHKNLQSALADTTPLWWKPSEVWSRWPTTLVDLLTGLLPIDSENTLCN